MYLVLTFFLEIDFVNFSYVVVAGCNIESYGIAYLFTYITYLTSECSCSYTICSWVSILIVALPFSNQVFSFELRDWVVSSCVLRHGWCTCILTRLLRFCPIVVSVLMLIVIVLCVCVLLFSFIFKFLVDHDIMSRTLCLTLVITSICFYQDALSGALIISDFYLRFILFQSLSIYLLMFFSPLVVTCISFTI